MFCDVIESKKGEEGEESEGKQFLTELAIVPGGAAAEGTWPTSCDICTAILLTRVQLDEVLCLQMVPSPRRPIICFALLVDPQNLIFLKSWRLLQRTDALNSSLLTFFILTSKLLMSVLVCFHDQK